MNKSEKLNKVKKFAKCLKGHKKISALCIEDEPGEWNIAYSFVEIEEPLLKVLDLLPKVLNAQSEKALEDILHEIGEEFRHIIYHIRDNRYYSYLLD